MKMTKPSYRLHLYSEPYGLLTEIDEIQCDVLIIDLEADDSKGLDLMTRVRHLKQQLHIVVLSDSEQYAMAAMKLGVQDYLKKPIDVMSLAQVLEKVQIKKQSNLCQ